MSQSNIDGLRYPVGRFARDPSPDKTKRAEWIDQVRALPEAVRAAVIDLDDIQLDTPYREDGWTVRQVVHHLADSHLNAYIRMRLALTEAEPTIKPYDQAAWADLADAASSPPSESIDLLDGLHRRWVRLLRSLSDANLARGFLHPETGRIMSLDHTLQIYAWHGRHHVAHITGLRSRLGWGP